MELLKGAFYMLIYTTCQTCQPLLLRQLVNSISDLEFDGLYYALALWATVTLAAFANQRHLHHVFKYVPSTSV